MIPQWTVVHLHGGAVAPDSDGWPENGALPGNRVTHVYENRQRATMLWYHDHAMALTALNVYSGLAGGYLIRDDEEDALGLPSGRHEIPLILADRNLDLGPDGRFTGRLLHKMEDGANEFFGPYTSVNGAIWPYVKLRAAPYRLRLLNASNARTYQLMVLDADGAPVTGLMTQIGTDGGLLGAPVPVPDGGLVLAPAERADVLLDLRGYAGTSLAVVNVAPAPYRGAAVAGPPGAPDPASHLPHPEVLRVDVGAPAGADSWEIPAVLSPTFHRLTHDDLPDDHGHRLISLVKSAKPLRELAPAAAGPGVFALTGPDGTTTGYQTLAGTWTDAPSIYVTQDSWEVWRILNLSGQTHPIHLHLVQFQILARQAYDRHGFDPATGEASPPVAYTGDVPVPANEAGWKDTVRVDPGELAVVAARFTGHSGRYVYHCHLLEHEDHGMMRPYVVLPAGLPGMPAMPMP
jgi:spore coat protein A